MRDPSPKNVTAFPLWQPAAVVAGGTAVLVLWRWHVFRVLALERLRLHLAWPALLCVASAWFLIATWRRHRAHGGPVPSRRVTALTAATLWLALACGLIEFGAERAAPWCVTFLVLLAGTAVVARRAAYAVNGQWRWPWVATSIEDAVRRSVANGSLFAETRRAVARREASKQRMRLLKDRLESDAAAVAVPAGALAFVAAPRLLPVLRNILDRAELAIRLDRRDYRAWGSPHTLEIVDGAYEVACAELIARLGTAAMGDALGHYRNAVIASAALRRLDWPATSEAANHREEIYRGLVREATVVGLWFERRHAQTPLAAAAAKLRRDLQILAQSGARAGTLETEFLALTRILDAPPQLRTEGPTGIPATVIPSWLAAAVTSIESVIHAADARPDEERRSALCDLSDVWLCASAGLPAEVRHVFWKKLQVRLGGDGLLRELPAPPETAHLSPSAHCAALELADLYDELQIERHEPRDGSAAAQTWSVPWRLRRQFVRDPFLPTLIGRELAK